MSSLKRGRTYNGDEHDPASAKRSRTGYTSSSGNRVPNAARACKPRVLYGSHPQSGVGKCFHSLPYPLDTLPKRTWETLNQGDKEGAVCSNCAKPVLLTPHQRKLFLVAERLSWETGATPFSARTQNEIALWAVNAELNIYDPAVEEQDAVLGGKRSSEDPSYPFKSEQEAAFAMRIIAKAESLTLNSWEVWRVQADSVLNPPMDKASTQSGSATELLNLDSDGLKDAESTGSCQPITIAQHGAQIFNSRVAAATKAVLWDGTTAESDVAKAAKGESPEVLERLTTKARNEPDFRALIALVSKNIATAQTRALFRQHVVAARKATSKTRQPLQALSLNPMLTTGSKDKAIYKAVNEPASPAVPRKVCSYQTLQKFYSLLDKIERTSPMGAKYLEAYAERLQAEECKDCWFSKNVLPELMEGELKSLATIASEAHLRAGLATLRRVSPPTEMPPLARGYVERYRAQYGQDPPACIMHQYTPKVLPTPVAAPNCAPLTTSQMREQAAAPPRAPLSHVGSTPVTYS